MSDLDSYLTRCYDLFLSDDEPRVTDEELCVCAKLIRHEEPEKTINPDFEGE